MMWKTITKRGKLFSTVFPLKYVSQQEHLVLNLKHSNLSKLIPIKQKAWLTLAISEGHIFCYLINQLLSMSCLKCHLILLCLQLSVWSQHPLLKATQWIQMQMHQLH